MSSQNETARTNKSGGGKGEDGDGSGDGDRKLWWGPMWEERQRKKEGSVPVDRNHIVIMAFDVDEIERASGGKCNNTDKTADRKEETTTEREKKGEGGLLLKRKPVRPSAKMLL